MKFSAGGLLACGKYGGIPARLNKQALGALPRPGLVITVRGDTLSASGSHRLLGMRRFRRGGSSIAPSGFPGFRRRKLESHALR